MEEKRIGVNFDDYALRQNCWRCANGDLPLAQEFYDWVQEADTREDKVIREVALQDCKQGNPVDFYNWIKPYARTWQY